MNFFGLISFYNLFCWFLFVCYFVLFFETMFLYVALALLEYTIVDRLASDSQRPASVSHAGIKGAYYHGRLKFI